MSVVKTQAKKMTDAEVTFISLVDHGASRAPFKIIKQEKKPMGKFYEGLDIGRLFTKKAELPVQIVGVIAKKLEDAEDMEAVKAHISAAGFDVESPEEVDGAIIFKQEEDENDNRETVTIRLNEDLAIVTKGFSPYSMDVEDGSFAEQCATQGFYYREYRENDGGSVFHCLPTLRPVL